MSWTRRLLQPAVVAACTALAAASAAAPFDDNLGYRWKSTSTGPNVTLSDSKNAPLRFRPNGDGGIPINLITDWTTLDPVLISFVQASNPDPNSGVTATHFFLNLELTNKTTSDWGGFRIGVIDENELPFFDVVTQENGSLRHPNRVHLHSDSFNYDLLDFPTVTGFFSVQKTTNARLGEFVIENRETDLSGETEIGANTGFYSMLFTGDTIGRNQLWAPTELIYMATPDADTLDFVNGASVLDIHARQHRNADNQTDTAFLLVLQAIPVAAPEPGTLGLLAAGAAALLCRRRWRVG